MLNFLRHNWYYLGGILFIALAFLMGFFGNLVSHIQAILIFSFMALLIHQFEEYALPGGFPILFNRIMAKQKEGYDRYPMNANGCLIVNVFLAYTFYIAAIIFPSLIWLGLAQVLFGIVQIFAHGVVMNIKMKSFYNPGMAATIFLHGPIGVYYIWYVVTNNLMTTGDLIIGCILTVIAALVLVGLPVKLSARKDSPYAFYEREITEFARQKIDKMQD